MFALVTDEMVDTLASKRNGTKKNDTIVASEVVSKEKWEVVGSHVGRRSFATNFYGKIPTPLITSITGHLTESSFLLYINRERLIDRKDTMKQLIDATKQPYINRMACNFKWIRFNSL